MKILYGVVGEGMGHATRSRVVLEHLRRSGHEVRIVASHGAATFLDRHFGTVLPIEGMKMVFDEKNRVSLGIMGAAGLDILVFRWLFVTAEARYAVQPGNCCALPRVTGLVGAGVQFF